jgi:hypothetical protein
MKSWEETTSTSPSRMHLGHHKPLIKPFHQENPPAGTPPELLEIESHRHDIAQAQVDLLNLAIKNQYTYERWHNVVNFLLAKEPGIPRCHKLRVIHLYEADLNALIGIKWRQLIHHVTDNRLLSPWQCGGFPGREAHTPVLLEELLMWEITRTSRRPLLCMDFDASSCYDRIIPSLSSFVSRSYGQHRKTCFIHGKFLRNAKFKLKTKLGVSDVSYSHCKDNPIYGTGQGSSCIPPIWGLISDKLFKVNAVGGNGANFVSPDSKVSARVGAVGFVDDTTEAINDFTNDSANPSLMVVKATNDAQRWTDLLAITGGALEIPKCKFHLASYKFAASGAPVLDPLTDAISGGCPKINIQPRFGESESQSLEYLQQSTSRRTLGCYKCPSGNFKTGPQAIRKNAIEKSQIVLNSHLDTRATHTYYFAVLFPSLSYSLLPISHYSSKCLGDVDKKIAAPFMNKLGYSRSTLRALRCGSTKFGGVNMHQPKDIQGSGQIFQLLKHLRIQSPFQKMWLIALHWAQLQSGFHTPLLQDPTVPAPHLEGLYIMSLREFLASIKGSIVTEHSYTIPLQRVHDRAIMDVVISSNLFTAMECKTINYCRMFLHAHSIADLTLAGGKYIDTSLLALDPSLLSSTSTLIDRYVIDHKQHQH